MQRKSGWGRIGSASFSPLAIIHWTSRYRNVLGQFASGATGRSRGNQLLTMSIALRRTPQSPVRRLKSAYRRLLCAPRFAYTTLIGLGNALARYLVHPLRMPCLSNLASGSRSLCPTSPINCKPEEPCWDGILLLLPHETRTQGNDLWTSLHCWAMFRWLADRD